MFHSYWLNGDAGDPEWGIQTRYRALSPHPWSLMTGPSHGSDGMQLSPSLRKTQGCKAAACDRSQLFSPKPGFWDGISFAQCLWPWHMQERCRLACERMRSILPQSIRPDSSLETLQRPLPPCALNPSHTGSVRTCSPLTSGP